MPSSKAIEVQSDSPIENRPIYPSSIASTRHRLDIDRLAVALASCYTMRHSILNKLANSPN
jgi:hypothetical protein